jgi:hypothetical protein
VITTLPVRSLSDGRGFWIPNEVVDFHLPFIKARGFTLYGLLARCPSHWEYPGVVDLACSLRTSETIVQEYLQRLRRVELLNDHDIKMILGEE